MVLSACSSRPIKTESVTVYVPKIVAVPENLSAPIPYPVIEINTNSDLSDYALALKSALDKANRQLEAIRNLDD